jgi:hypothetical protein
MRERSTGKFAEDKVAYSKLKHIATVIESRSQPLPPFLEADYLADRTAAGL